MSNLYSKDEPDEILCVEKEKMIDLYLDLLDLVDDHDREKLIDFQDKFIELFGEEVFAKYDWMKDRS